MDQKLVDRLNELTRLSRERELTEKEQAERAKLRQECVAAWRKSAEAVLENTYIIDEKGNKRKLGKKR